MGEISFNLDFETEVVILLEVGLPSSRVENFNKESNFELLQANLDVLEEVRKCAAMMMVTYRQKVSH